ncbi:MAG: nucleoside phosphorylase [Spirochaetaceae bacterium]|nr:nucleoside phosphorylase [Spirochaetaceae bacterium]
MSTLYMGADPGQIGEYVIFSGDPWRVEVVKQYLDNPVHIAFKREYNTYTGTYKGLKITVTSTGIGSPSAAIAMEEMYQCGMKTALRMGTAMALEDSMLGHFIIPLAAMRRESTSKTYVEESYPAVADMDLVNTLNETVAAAGKKAYNGIVCTMDGFYSQMRESRFSGEWDRDINGVFEALKRLRVSGIDMETACMLTLGRLMGVKTAVLTAVTVLENLRKKVEGAARTNLEDTLCQLALEGLYRFSQKNTERGGHEEPYAL